MNELTIREAFADARRYWEPRRIIYNLILLFMAGVGYLEARPEMKGPMTWDQAQIMVALAVLANLFYCAAYVVDVPIQFTGARDLWLRLRWALFTLGLVAASVQALACTVLVLIPIRG